MKNQRKYDKDYKVEAVKLAQEVGTSQASTELGVPQGTLSGWIRAAKDGNLDMGSGQQTPTGALSLAAELQEARKRIKELEKENKQQKELIDFLEEASAFFAASRQRSGKKKD